MNIVVVTRYTSDKGKFIHDATEWVLKNPVDRTLYSVGMNCNVRIGPYNIKFVSWMADVHGLRSIDILYYHSVNSSMLQWEVEHRMTPGGKIFWLLNEFMEEVFRRVKEEQIKAKLNGLFGYRPMSINYPEYFLKLKEESQNKINLVLLREAIDRIKKEETTMNCDIRSNIKDVIFSYPATIILWKDGTKTIVKAGKDEKYDPEKGFAMAVCKKMFGNEGNYYEVFKEYVPVTYYIADKKDIMVTDRVVSDEVEKEIVGMINECQEKGKIWPGLTRKKWKELVNKVAKRVKDKRKKDAAKEKCEQKKEGIRSGKYPWGMGMSKYMTPPEEGVNSSGKEE